MEAKTETEQTDECQIADGQAIARVPFAIKHIPGVSLVCPTCGTEHHATDPNYVAQARKLLVGKELYGPHCPCGTRIKITKNLVVAH